MADSILSGTLADRPAAYGVIQECLTQQSAAPPRGTLARIVGSNPLHPAAVSWYQGATGERLVGRLLAGLGPEWSVLHSVPVGSGMSDIGHVVIGPGGVFTLNTKHHNGAKVWVSPKLLMVNGQREDHLGHSRYESRRASALLSAALGRKIEARGLVVLVEPMSVGGPGSPDDVTVLCDRDLVSYFNRRVPVIDDFDRREILSAAANPRTWHTTADAVVDPDAVARFEALRGSVLSAARLRSLGSLGFALGLAAVVLAVLTQLG
ncbi:nuclease-related domain-containing protein [Homoserinimonas hongtaonis]|uniref:nuclease-related domain-containing protein n=1 Tax=Homoserinimonas hongtaonis TaxID=2079791 RepID=UPI000D3C4A87|nr:nuclease-related domain-containing protein [Salinibacterium hongtaonis]AWB88486.1 NERD domain-containing protein [Salinibacterium hongtaonis]